MCFFGNPFDPKYMNINENWLLSSGTQTSYSPKMAQFKKKYGIWLKLLMDW